METPAESCGTWQLCQEPSIVFISVSPSHHWTEITTRTAGFLFPLIVWQPVRFSFSRGAMPKNMTNLLSRLQFSGVSGAKPILFIKMKKRIAKFPSHFFIYFSGLHLLLKQEVEQNEVNKIRLEAIFTLVLPLCLRILEPYEGFSTLTAWCVVVFWVRNSSSWRRFSSVNQNLFVYVGVCVMILRWALRWQFVVS